MTRFAGEGDVVTSTDVAVARDRLDRRFGSALAGKATDRFCLAVEAPASLFSLEGALAAPRPAQAAIVEFAPGTSNFERRAQAEIDAMQGASDAVERARRGDPLASQAVAKAHAKAERDEFERAAGPIRAEIERTIAALGAAAGGRRRPGHRLPRVEACWLNQTLRTVGDPRALAEVAADPGIESIDLPRRIELEDAESSATLAAMASVRARLGLSGEGVTVGVIDSEVLLEHPALQHRVIQRANYTEEPFGSAARHGTAIAGVIAAQSADYDGIAPGATVYNYKVAATNRWLNGDDFDGAKALMRALDDGVRVVNCSWGTGPAGRGQSREARACDTAWRRGLTIIKSAGNDGPAGGTVTAPADAEGVIVVGATNGPGGAVEDYSGRGPTPDGRPRPHLVAPGGSRTLGMRCVVETGGIGALWGTSYAAPHVAALVALLLAREPHLTPSDLRERALGACQQLSGAGESEQGAGIIAAEALFA